MIKRNRFIHSTILIAMLLGSFLLAGCSGGSGGGSVYQEASPSPQPSVTPAVTPGWPLGNDFRGPAVPQNIFVDSLDNLWVADNGGNSIQKFSSSWRVPDQMGKPVTQPKTCLSVNSTARWIWP